MSDINSGLLNDVLIVGNELSGKLNEIGVSNTFGKASEGKDDLISLIRMAIDGIDMVVDTNSYVSLTATNPYMLTGETTDIVAKLRNGVCRPLTNKNVTIGQSVFIDDGTTASHNDSWTVTNGTMTRMDSYTRLVESAQTLMCQMNSGYISPTSIVEFDFKAIDGVKNWGLVYIRNSGGGNSLADLSLNNVGGEIGEWIHLKIVFNNTDTITIYSSKLDNPITKTLSSTSPNYRLLFYGGGANTELHFKNVKVYETIKGVTDENGEFTLSDVSVSGNTTFTATYSTVSDSVTIYYCKFADLTGDTSKYIYDSRCNVTSTNNEITVTWVSGTYIFWANKGDTSTEFDYTGDFTVEFDLLSNGNNATIQIYDNSATTYYSKTLYQLNSNNAGHFKIVKDGQVFKTFVDGVENTRQQVNSNITNACRVGFRFNSASTIKFRNFVIY